MDFHVESRRAYYVNDKLLFLPNFQVGWHH